MKNKIKQKINTIFIDCIKPNWDGYNASSLPIELKQITLDFIDDMPTGVKMPHISPDASGVISLTWFNDDRSKELIAHITKDGKLHFNFFEDEKEEWFENNVLKGYFPENLKNILKKHFFSLKDKIKQAGFKNQKECAEYLDVSAMTMIRWCKNPPVIFIKYLDLKIKYSHAIELLIVNCVSNS